MALKTSIKTLFLILVYTIAADGNVILSFNCASLQFFNSKWLSLRIFFYVCYPDRVAFMGESVSLICQVTNSYSQVWIKPYGNLYLVLPNFIVWKSASCICIPIGAIIKKKCTVVFLHASIGQSSFSIILYARKYSPMFLMSPCRPHRH